jgi:hypothetical protein
MSDPTASASRAGSIVQTLCNAEGREVVLRFNEPITVPESKYTGRSYQLKTLSKTRVDAKITLASVKDAGETFICYAEIETSQLGFENTDAPFAGSSQQDGEPERCGVEVMTTRDPSKYDLSIEEAEQAIENGRAQAVLPPWDNLPAVTVTPMRTDECFERYRESNGYIQYSAPEHKLGTLIDVRIK